MKIFDYGPPGCALVANIVDLWWKHFIIEEDMLELNCTSLTPEDIFKTSGYVNRFADWMCKDPTKGEYLRADYLVENVLEARLNDAYQLGRRKETRALSLHFTFGQGVGPGKH